MRTACIVVAAGSGTRFGGLQPKQFQLLHDRPLYEWAVDRASASTDFVVLVVAKEHRARHVDVVGVDVIVEGGATRSQSVRNGLAVIPDEFDTVLVHDAARPLASKELFEAVGDAIANGADAAIPGVPVTDTVKRVDAQPSEAVPSTVLETVDRLHLVAVQTPQAFRADVLRRAHSGQPDASDDAALVEALGGKVVVVRGETTNLKVTHAHDLSTLEGLFAS
jgi:2-C-methyl-D-erythritol 4-phosphate cytidylyltransferase